MNLAEEVYYSLLGQTVEAYRLKWVDSACYPGSSCDQNYGRIFDAYDRLRDRLGAGVDDPDVEIIIGSMLEIQKELCLKMFEYGQKRPRL